MSKNNYMNSKVLTVSIVTAVTIVCAISGFAVAGGGVMATAALWSDPRRRNWSSNWNRSRSLL